MGTFRRSRLELLAVFALYQLFSEFGICNGHATYTKGGEGSNETKTFDPTPRSSAEEVYLMDLVPSGSLPDSVYRELAWYSILQIQPIPASIKNHMVAKLISQHSLGRPHVLLELNQGYRSPNTETRKVISEKGVVWARSQESNKQIILEAMRRGGNGITLRSVMGPNETNEMMITSGLTFKCPKRSTIMKNSFKVPEKRTAIGSCLAKGGTILNGVRTIDPCLEAEHANLEFSFGEGWVYCMGHGEIGNQNHDDGKIDCGTKTKVLYSSVLEKCAIDRSVIIKFEYFGDMPRKDLLQEQSICHSWSPCTLQYMYRLEPPPEIQVDVDANTDSTEEKPCIGCSTTTTKRPQKIYLKKDQQSLTTENLMPTDILESSAMPNSEPSISSGSPDPSTIAESST